jgi:UDP-N-acetylmuramate: L-alanyl-gamma-D-glutamyl-meso-diaminopimelate ligase
MADSNQQKWVHLIAIGGTGMASIAGLLKDRGFFVSGSDGPIYPPMSDYLKDREIPVRSEYSTENLKGSTWGIERERPDLVIVGNAISKGHVEASIVEEWVSDAHSFRRMSFPEALAEYAIQEKQSLVVAGTHGKTTTVSIAAAGLDAIEKAPGFFIGGIPLNFGYGCRGGTGDVFVSEGDEYDTAYWDKGSKFLHYKPSWVQCTGIEFDHADIFKDLAAIDSTFSKLLDLTREGWVCIHPDDAPIAASILDLQTKAQKRGLPFFTYGFSKNSDYQITEMKSERLPWDKDQVGTLLKVKTPKKEFTFHSPSIGRHNALNVAGVLAMLIEAGHIKTAADVTKCFASFKGVKRRQEERARYHDLVVIDDFAHHPRAIAETIDAIRQRYPDYKIAAFFEPRSATSARNILFEDFVKSFLRADGVFLITPTKLNVPESERLKVGEVIAQIQERAPQLNGSAFTETNADALLTMFWKWKQAHEIKSPKVLALVMSNGPFDGLITKMIEHKHGGT